MTYATWMSAHGQGKHWTVANEADRAKVGWEDAAQGYWFTAEVAGACPGSTRAGTTSRPR